MKVGALGIAEPDRNFFCVRNFLITLFNTKKIGKINSKIRQNWKGLKLVLEKDKNCSSFFYHYRNCSSRK